MGQAGVDILAVQSVQLQGEGREMRTLPGRRWH